MFTRRHLDHRHLDRALLVQQLAAQRLVEALDRVLGAAVRRLQRDPAVGQRRPDLDDRAAVAGAHPLQHGHRGVDVAQVADLGGPPVLLRRDVVEPCEDRRERDVDPDVDRPSSSSIRSAAASTWSGVGHVGTTNDVPCRRAAPPPARPPLSPVSPRASSATRSPRRANSTAAARPIPPLAPVTATTRPAI